MTRRRYGTGHAGLTHCGSWMAVPMGEKYGWKTRVVCNRRPHTTGGHRSMDGWTWSGRGELPKPPAPDTAP